MDHDAFMDAAAQRGMHTIHASELGLSAWSLIAWGYDINGHITLRNEALYVTDELSTEHGPFATFDEAYAIYVLLGSCRTGN